MGRYFGGIIRNSTDSLPDTNAKTGAASGVWTIEEAAQLHGSDKYPSGETPLDGRANTTTAYIGQGWAGSRSVNIDQKSFDSNADATNWADFTYTASARARGTVTNYTIGLVAGGFNYSGYAQDINTCNKITFSTQADAVSHGTISGGRVSTSCHMSATKGFWNGGRNSSHTGVIEQKDITSTGGTSDWGYADSSGTNLYDTGAMGTPTKMIICRVGSFSVDVNTIAAVDMTSSGNGTDFGDLLANTDQAFCAGNDTVGHVRDHHDGDTRTAVDKITFATNSDAVDHGDATGDDEIGIVGDDVRTMIFGGGVGGYQDRVETLTYASGGNVTDYGDLVAAHSGDGGHSHN
jgi:hypothetical protein